MIITRKRDSLFAVVPFTKESLPLLQCYYGYHVFYGQRAKPRKVERLDFHSRDMFPPRMCIIPSEEECMIYIRGFRR